MAAQRVALILFLSIICLYLLVSPTVSSVRPDDGEEVESMGAALSYLNPRANVSVSSPRRNSNPNNSRQTARTKARGNSTARRATVRRIVHPSLHAAWDESNHLCALAKFQATFTIKYETATGASQLIDKMPPNARSKGRCDQFDDEPVLDIVWKDIQTPAYMPSSKSQQQLNSTLGFTFRIIFQKYTEDDDRWGVQQMQLLYNTGHPVFHGVIKPKKIIVRSNKDDYRLQFRTNFGSSLLCPSPPPIQMYDSDGNLLVIARLSNMQLQAFDFSDARLGSNFDSFERCGQVSFGSGVARQNLKTNKNVGLTFGIGIMTCCIAALTVVGYAIYRSNELKTKQYKTMDD